jgi:hypothetical protein
MSQATTEKTNAAAAKTILCKAFTEQSVAGLIDPMWILLQLQTAGIQYQPQSMMGFQARSVVIEDIKCYLANYYKANNIDITTDEATAKQINTWFESAIIKSNPVMAIQSGVISPERAQEILAATGFGMGFSPFGQMGGFGGMGMGMPGFGAQGNPFAQMGMGGFGGMGGMGMPAWNKKTDAKPQQQQPAFNPMMMGMMGMGMGMNPMMGGMGFGFPGMNGI